MELKRLVQILRKSWILIIAFVFLGVSGGALASLLTPVQYSSSTRLFVAVQILPGSTTGDLVQGNNFAAQKVLSYLDVATTPRVLDPVIEGLALDTTAADLARRVTATAQPDSVIIEIATTGGTPAAATALSRSIADSFADVVVNQLERPADDSASPVKIEVLQPAVEPENPVAPVVPLNLALGALIGLSVGLLVAVIIGLLDSRIQGRADIEEITDIPVLGGIAFDSSARKQTLIAKGHNTPRAEAFRTLRTNLQFVGFERPTRTLVVTSAVPSEGKTTTLANLAIVLAENGATVAVVDADLRVPRLAGYLGLEGWVGLSDVLAGRVPLDDVLQSWGIGEQIMVLPAGRNPPNPSELLGSQAMSELISDLGKKFDYVLIDAPPVLPVTDAAVLSRFTDGTLFVAAARRVKANEVRAAILALETAGTTPIGVVLSMLPAKGPDAYNSAYAVQDSEVAPAPADIAPAPAPAEQAQTTRPAAARRAPATAPDDVSKDPLLRRGPTARRRVPGLHRTGAAEHVPDAAGHVGDADFPPDNWSSGGNVSDSARRP